MTWTSQTCPDCRTATGEAHARSCCIARCKGCGFSECGCEHEYPMTKWTGHYPGDEEIAEGIAEDYHDLFIQAVTRKVMWDQRRERWVRPPR